MAIATWQRLLITGSLLAAAFICYGIGYMPGFKGFFLVGAVFETVFWVRILHHRPRRNQRLQALREQNP